MDMEVMPASAACFKALKMADSNLLGSGSFFQMGATAWMTRLIGCDKFPEVVIIADPVGKYRFLLIKSWHSSTSSSPAALAMTRATPPKCWSSEFAAFTMQSTRSSSKLPCTTCNLKLPEEGTNSASSFVERQSGKSI
eukprot:Pompholyxophrys_punicea_v1_NODE_342_length_2207_cov_3.778810.p2 type:complete len:138 gc:universal NODE_342_length_2207_cov_3.778810:481-68(-)